MQKIKVSLVLLFSLILSSVFLSTTSVKINNNINTLAKSDLTIERTFVFHYDGETIIMTPWAENPVTYDVSKNVIYISRITKDTYDGIELATKKMLSENKKEIIFDFNSPGGDTNAMDIIIIQMQKLKEKGIKVITRVEKNHSCMSACTLIFLSGDKRIASHKSVFMIHSPYFSHTSPVTNDAEKIFEEIVLNSTRKKFIDKFTTMCGKDVRIINDIKDLIDHFYVSKELHDICPAYITDLTDPSLLGKGF